MTSLPFNQLHYQTHSQTFSANSQAQCLLGLAAQGKEGELIELLGQEQWQHLKYAATSGQAVFVALDKQPNCIWLGQRDNDTIVWIISPQPNLQRQIEQWQHEARLASVGQVMAGICHEINQPLNAMRLRLYGLQQLATLGPVSDLHNHLQELDNQIERCASTLVNMRQLVGHQPISHHQFDLADSIQQIYKLLASQLHQQGIELVLRAPLPKSLLFGQAQRFEQVLINLINNARDAILEQADQGQISLTLTHTDNTYQLQVIDNGPGIPDALQEKIFSPYFTNKQHQGTGLGLALCRDFVEELGGKLTLTSNPEQTCFTIALPQNNGTT
ncbi:MAG: HAMP domain-containing sensor histidine kinase [Gammaproteobacteria bacterium]|jgi:C4-dicarboxylate-specific signal transduction histidine kinase|nr:HAMP domain-containing sensor histidine kinase [Gammaproteobacteria bacterium]